MFSPKNIGESEKAPEQKKETIFIFGKETQTMIKNYYKLIQAHIDNACVLVRKYFDNTKACPTSGGKKKRRVATNKKAFEGLFFDNQF